MTSEPVYIASIVEGDGDELALPLLLRRMAEQVGVYGIEIRRPHRIPRTKILTETVRNALLMHRHADLLIVLFDADEDDPAECRRRVLEHSGDTDPIIAIAVKEYEAWLLAGAKSLRGASSVADDAVFDGDPEEPRDAKGRLQQLMLETYRETLHQAKLTAQLDLEQVRQRSASFATFYREFTQALIGRQATTPPPAVVDEGRGEPHADRG